MQYIVSNLNYTSVPKVSQVWHYLVRASLLLLFCVISNSAFAWPDLGNVLQGSGAFIGHVAPTPPPPPPTPPPGPPQPSSNARGSLSINEIHRELDRIYKDCIRDSNAAFRGEAPEPGDDTHKHLNCDTCTLKRMSDWRCSAGDSWVGTDWCNDVTMEFEKNCNMAIITEEEGFFNCENENEWFVQLNNYFHYKLEFFPGIQRDLYQTAEIRVYCDGWDNVFGGTIKVVQLPPGNHFGLPGTLEQLFPPLKKAVMEGLRAQYINDVDTMHHIIDVERLSGARCSSLGVDGDETIPLAERNIVWDIPILTEENDPN